MLSNGMCKLPLSSMLLTQGQLADRLVHSTYLAAFVARAAYLLDWELVYRHNATFWASYAVDVRASASPTRTHGVAPNCRGCKDGQFKDIYSHSMVSAHRAACRASMSARWSDRRGSMLYSMHALTCVFDVYALCGAAAGISLVCECYFTWAHEVCAEPTRTLPLLLQVAARDDRYQAIQTFRLIGYILANVGYPCSALWDPQQPLDMHYGPYEKAMCLTTL